MIDRNALNTLQRDAAKFPVLGLIGPRQSGKTTLAKLMMHNSSRPAMYLDLEYVSDQMKLEDAEQFLKQHSEKMVVIDEVQRMPQLFSLLRALVDEHRVPCRFMLLGSASPLIIKNASESLAGRISYTELGSVNLVEIENRFHFRHHWFRGGFPEALLEPDGALAKVWLDNFIKSYIEKDLPNLGLDISPVMLFRFWTMLAHLNGSLSNASQIGRSLGVSSPTVSRYLDYMEGAFLIRRLQPYFANTKKRLVKSPKIYLRDTGLLHRLLRLASADDLLAHPSAGLSWEGYVVEQVAQNLPSDVELYFYRTQAGAECDMVLCRSTKPFAAIEIKHTSSPSVGKGLTESILDLKTKENYIVTPDSDSFVLKNGIKVCGLRSFLHEVIQKM